MTASVISPYVLCVWRSTSTVIATAGAINSSFMAKALSMDGEWNFHPTRKVSFATPETTRAGEVGHG